MKKIQEQPTKELTPEEVKRLRYLVGNIKACNRLIKYCSEPKLTRPFIVTVLRVLSGSLADDAKKILKQ
jgi:hypothetical protein